VLIFIELIFEKSCWIREGHKLQDIKTKDMLHVERIVPRGVVRSRFVQGAGGAALQVPPTKRTIPHAVRVIFSLCCFIELIPDPN